MALVFRIFFFLNSNSTSSFYDKKTHCIFLYFVLTIGSGCKEGTAPTELFTQQDNFINLINTKHIPASENEKGLFVFSDLGVSIKYTITINGGIGNETMTEMAFANMAQPTGPIHGNYPPDRRSAQQSELRMVFRINNKDVAKQ